MAALAETRDGTGPPVLLLHGGMMSGARAWTEQAPLEERWSLIRVDRAGYAGSAAHSDGEDLELDAELLAPSLEPGTHVVGHSSGAVAAMLTAARRPACIASLTLIEPPVFNVAAGDSAAARDRLRFNRDHFARLEGDDVAWAIEHFKGSEGESPSDALLEQLRDNVRTWRRFVKKPWEIDLPLGALRAATYPKLVLSGGYSPGFEDTCDVLASLIGAERDVVEGAGHLIQRAGPPFNERLERLMTRAG
jgi:pimeloyl-ACP methyl ester carboxylesterase